jgi:DNA polymerase-3 subunit gamma/tau
VATVGPATPRAGEESSGGFATGSVATATREIAVPVAVAAAPAVAVPPPPAVATAPVGAASGLSTVNASTHDPIAGGYGIDVVDEPSLDDDDAPTHPGAQLTGEAAAMELLRAGLGATVIEQRPAG